MRCAVKDCMNHTDQGRFVGLLCAPCHSFISGGDGGVYSQVSRNTKREWVGLTDMEKEQFYNEVDDWDKCVDWVEAKLKDKNT